MFYQAGEAWSHKRKSVFGSIRDDGKPPTPDLEGVSTARFKMIEQLSELLAAYANVKIITIGPET